MRCWCARKTQITSLALAFAAAGYHLLVEKPMAPTAEECRRLVAAVTDAGVMMAVAHVMRYMPYTEQLRR